MTCIVCGLRLRPFRHLMLSESPRSDRYAWSIPGPCVSACRKNVSTCSTQPLIATHKVSYYFKDLGVVEAQPGARIGVGRLRTCRQRMFSLQSALDYRILLTINPVTSQYFLRGRREGGASTVQSVVKCTPRVSKAKLTANLSLSLFLVCTGTHTWASLCAVLQ